MNIVISGPGGVGKGTIVRRLLELDPNLWLSRSWTTRAKRVDDADDAYVWATREEFERALADGGFLEHTEFLGNLYGTPLPDPSRVPAGSDLVLEIEVDGASQVKELDPDALLIFVVPPSSEEQERRLRGRGDPEELVVRRLAKAAEEIDAAAVLGAFEVVNDDLDEAVDRILDLIRSARNR